jgi:tetratricopeptide (TPR) repeat protein
MNRQQGFTRWAAAGRAAALVLVLATTFWACGDPLLKGGQLHLEAGRYDKAAAAFEEVVAGHPAGAEAHYWLACAYSQLDRVPEAVMEFDRAVALDSALTDRANGERRRCWRQQYVRGESFLHEALALPARSAQRADEERQAQAALEAAVLLDPTRAMTHYQLYRLFAARGDGAAAEREFRQALDGVSRDREVGPELVPLLKTRGRAAVEGGRYADAVSAYDAAARLRPDDVDLMVDQASAHLLLAEDETRGSAADRDADLIEAGRILEKVRRLRPTDPDALFNLATVRARTGGMASADTLLRAYLALRPRDPDAWQLLEQVAEGRGRAGAARTAGLAARALALKRPVSEPVAWARRAAEKFGPSSELGRLFGELGSPDEIHTARESNGPLVEIWFYFTRQRVAAFREGAAEGDPLRFGQGR